MNSPSTTAEPTEPLPSLIERGRLSGLDALRGIAAIAVVLTHFTGTYFLIYNAPRPAISLSLGDEAVKLFFIISGFVILMTLDRSKSLSDFAVSRFARLFPIFWTCIWVTYIIVHLGGLSDRATTFRHAIINMSMMPSIVGSPPVDIVYWSLTVELFFYFIMAAILGLRARRFLPLIASLFVLLGIFTHYRSLESLLPVGGYRLNRMLILQYWHLFFFGIIIFEMRKNRQWWHIPGLLLCVLATFVHSGGQGGLIVIGAAALVYASTNYKVPGLSNPVLLYLGMISYSLYLVHANVGYVVMKWSYRFGAPDSVAIGAAIAVTIALASALCFLVERPSNAFLRGKYKEFSARRTARAIKA